MSSHWTDKDLLDRLYGIGPDDSHLEECAGCGRRWHELVSRRREIVSPPQVSEAFLAAQRRSIYRRLERRPHSGFVFAPAVAAASVVLAALLLSGPAPAPEPTRASSEDQFFTEIYSLVATTEPRAAAPIHGLFED